MSQVVRVGRVTSMQHLGFLFGRNRRHISRDGIDVVRARGCRYRALLLVTLCSEERFAAGIGRRAGGMEGFSDVRYVT
jgi:hypothetical protein